MGLRPEAQILDCKVRYILKFSDAEIIEETNYHSVFESVE